MECLCLVICTLSRRTNASLNQKRQTKKNIKYCNYSCLDKSEWIAMYFPSCNSIFGTRSLPAALVGDKQKGVKLEKSRKKVEVKKLQAAPTLSSAVEASSHLHLVTDARRFAPSTCFSNLRPLLRTHNAAPWTSHERKKVAKPTSAACQRKQFEEPLNILHKYFWTFSHVFTVKQNTPVHLLLSQRAILLNFVS